MKFIWQSPRYFLWAGLYIQFRNKRYRLLRFGPQ